MTEKQGLRDRPPTPSSVCDPALRRIIISPRAVVFSFTHCSVPLPPTSKITRPTVNKIGVLCALERCTKMEEEFTSPPLGISMSILKDA